MTGGRVSRGDLAAAWELRTVRATRELRLRWITGEGRGLAWRPVALATSPERSRQRGAPSKSVARLRAQERLSVSSARSDSHVSLAAWRAAVVQRRKG